MKNSSQLSSELFNHSNISVLAIQNYGPSGTLFLQSLVDNHPNILSIPALYVLHYYSFWEDQKNKEVNSLIGAFNKNFSYWFDPDCAKRRWGLHQMGTNMEEKIYISKSRFNKKLNELFINIEFPSRKQFLLGIYIAYSYALKKNTSSPIVINFPVHSMSKKYVKYLVDDFKKIKFIYTIREPIQTIGSLIKHISKLKGSLNPVECSFSQLINNYMQHSKIAMYVYSDRPYFSEYSKESKAIRLEDLHNKPMKILEALCEFLQIPWDDCLLKSTFDGKKWWNRPESKRISGFGEKIIKQSHSNLLNGFDKVRLHALLIKRYSIWQYKVESISKFFLVRFLLFFTLIFPFKSEYKIFFLRITKSVKNLSNKPIKLIITIFGKLGIKENSIKTLAKTFCHSKPNNIKFYFFWSSISIFAIIIMPVVFIIIIRDYIMIRWWLYRGWFVNRFGINSLVKPIIV